MLISIFTLLTAGFAQATTPKTFVNEDAKNYVELTQKSSATSVEEFLSELKTTSPALFDTYLLGYRSRSLQNSSAQNPRAILFSSRADLVVAFNGDPQHRGFNKIENMAFNYETDRFEFFESDFTDGKKAKLSAVNPKKCLECHQSSTRQDVDPRPNWEPYNKWPGFYGTMDDYIGGFYKTEDYLLRDFPLPEDYLIVQEVLSELGNYWSFASQSSDHPRYKHLKPYPVNGSTNNPSAPNSGFTKKLVVMNMRRVSRLMTQDKEIFDFAKWNIAAYKKCSNFRVSDEVDKFLRSRTTAPLAKYYGPNSYYFADVVALFFEPFGIDTQDWSMDFKTQGRFAFQERFGSPNNAWVEFQQGFEKYFMSDPELKDADCSKLNSEAEKRFGNIEAVKALYEKRKASFQPPASKPLLERCISCHVDNAGVTPFIPFNDSKALQLALSKTGYKRGTLLQEIRHRLGSNAQVTEQMPPAGLPTAQQKRDLMEFLNSLETL